WLRRRTRHIALSRNVQNVPVSSGGRRVHCGRRSPLLRAPLQMRRSRLPVSQNTKLPEREKERIF
ncbi:unnamed protein product, partial [Ectocarpus sp. 13 AM-2016]